jgi:hypothetical protein
LFYSFCLDEAVPADHRAREIAADAGPVLGARGACALLLAHRVCCPPICGWVLICAARWRSYGPLAALPLLASDCFAISASERETNTPEHHRRFPHRTAHCDRRSLGNHHHSRGSETPGSRVSSELDRRAAEDEERAESSRGSTRRVLGHLAVAAWRAGVSRERRSSVYAREFPCFIHCHDERP